MDKQPTLTTTKWLRNFIVALGVSVSLAGLAGCVMVPPRESAQVMEEADAWVVVTFADRNDRFDLEVLGAMIEYELAADAALQVAGVGWIDGNDIGNYQYDLYFSGTDSAAMWEILEPVFAEAPLQWTSVELRDGLDDENPRIITP
ncbi:hypothetical protein C8A06_0282 [Microbacteriaceae bacterium MWH-Ta3]|nr:hypothetical protein C8A06_0282 [Microbacteriaceae bacterium MWH-Ta3]